jgi:hypothetical protein
MGACASSASPSAAAPPASAPAPVPSSIPASASTAPAAPALPSFDALASRVTTLAPGMREVSRGDLTSEALPPTHLVVRADTADTCARVALAAEPAVRVSLTDGRGDVLAQAGSLADGAIAAHGPVCVRKGDTITLNVEATAPWAVRFVAWASP